MDEESKVHTTSLAISQHPRSRRKAVLLSHQWSRKHSVDFPEDQPTRSPLTNTARHNKHSSAASTRISLPIGLKGDERGKKIGG